MGARLSRHSLLKKAAELGVELFVADGRIKGRGPKPDPAFVADLRAHEAEIVAFLQNTQTIVLDFETFFSCR
jgi:TubC N-terminal docking domain